MSDEQTKIGGQYGEIRSEISMDSLNAFLNKNCPRIRVPVEAKQFKYGQSNPTYFLKDSTGAKYVMRKKPAGQLLSSTAHAVEREFRVLNAIHGYNCRSTTKPEARVPIPEPLVLCEDKRVLGTAFYVMEFLDGRIFEDVHLPTVPPEQRKEIWMAASVISYIPLTALLRFEPRVSSLARLSALSPIDIGLKDFGPHTPYFPRQLKSMSRVSQAQSKAVDVDTHKAVGPIPKFEEAMDWYRSHLPDESKTGLRIVHGDYKMDNIVFHKTENRVIGILDWELCTLGSPLADLANMTIPFWVDASHLSIAGLKNDPGAPLDLEDVRKEYCRLTGNSYPLEGAVYASSWMIFRLAIITQGIAARYALRQASSEKAVAQGSTFVFWGNLAQEIIKSQGGGGIPAARL